MSSGRVRVWLRRRQLRMTAHAVCLVLMSSVSGAATERVRFERPDGAVLVGEFATADSARRPAVLLIHQAQSARGEFDFLLPDLHRLGVHTLAVDLRGHGDSTKPERIDGPFFKRLFKDPDYVPPDIKAVIEWMSAHPAIDAERIGIIGGSVGANLAFLASGAGWGVRTAVLLSGNSENANLLAAGVDGFDPRGLLIIAAEKDPARERFARELYERAGSPKRVEILRESLAHGVSILRESPELRRAVLAWLTKYLVE